MADVRRHGDGAPRRGRSWASAAVVRVAGLVMYAAIAAWCAWQLPASLPFVAPAAVAGAILHVIKGRPWFGLLACGLLVVVLPVVLAPALGTGAFSDLTGWINDPKW